MPYKKALSNFLLYMFFPIGILFLGFSHRYIFLTILFFAYFLTFFLLKTESLFRIMAGYNEKKGNFTKATKNLYSAYKLKSSSIETANNFIYMLLKTGKLEQCKKIIEQVEKKGITEAENQIFLSNKALYLWKTNAISASIKTYEQLINEHKSTSVYSAFGYIITLGGNLEKALQVNIEAYEYNKDSKAIMDNLGLTYIKLGKLDEAYDIYTDLLSKNPNFPEAYYNMAILMQLKQEISETRYYLKKALEKPFNSLSTVSKKEVSKKLDQINRLHGKVL